MFQFLKSGVAGCTLWTLGPYEGLLKECILSVKSRGHQALAEELSQAAADHFLSVIKPSRQVNGVLAVPSSQQGQKFRGFSLPRMMESALVKSGGGPGLSTDLRRAFRSTIKSSKGLSRSERLNRGRSLPDQEKQTIDRGLLLLLDDVVTTGGTLSLCIEQAKLQGWSEILCLALAEFRDS